MYKNKITYLAVATGLIVLGFVYNLNAGDKHAHTLSQATLLSKQINLSYLMSDVHWLADDDRFGRASGTVYEDEVAQWLIDRYKQLELKQFNKLGLSNYTHQFEFHVYDDAGIEHPAFGENIIGVIPGSEKPEAYLIVSSHYDHLGVEDGQIYNGADDDASGVAAMLEIARVISGLGVKPKKSILFVAFSAEEIGRYGSNNFCYEIYDRNLSDAMIGLNLEMLGAAKGRLTYINVWEQEHFSTQPIIKAVKAGSDVIDVPMIATASIDPGSDALELLDCGVVATTMDVGGGEQFEFNHPYYHSPDDKPEHIYQKGFHEAVQVASIAVWLLANE